MDDFRADYTPLQMMKMGVFGGTYFSPIDSSIAKARKKIPSWIYKKLQASNIPKKKYLSKQFDVGMNYYKVKAGTTLKGWETKGWIRAPDYFGWYQWYWNYFYGRRIASVDAYQIGRYINFKTRFGNRKKKSLRLKQALLQWGMKS